MPVTTAMTVAKSSYWYPMLFCGQLGQPAYLCATCCAGVTLTQCHLSIQILLPSQVVFFGFQHTGGIAYVMPDRPILTDLTSLPSGERSIYNRAYQFFFFFFNEGQMGPALATSDNRTEEGETSGYLVTYKLSLWSRREHLI